ncbi:uncharacterized protein LOC144115233 [Amblyomma americanum]
MSALHCWAVNCKNSLDKNPSLRFFSFPRDRTLSKQWCINSGRGPLSSYDRRSLHRRGAVLCEKHFKPSQFMTPKNGSDDSAPKQLLWNAIPTVFPLPLKTPEGNEPKAVTLSSVSRKRSRPSFEEAESSGEESITDVNPAEKINVENYEMAALPTFGRERLLGIAKKQWHEIKRLRANVRNLERALASSQALDETYLLNVLERNLDGPLLDRVADIIVEDFENDSSAAEDI